MKFLFSCLLLLGLMPAGYAQGIYDNDIKPAAAIAEQYMPRLQGKRVGLVINQTSVVDGVSLLDILIGKGVKVTRIFVPEHGFRGKADAGAKVDNTVDSTTGVPVISLYGKNKKPAAKDLQDIDILVYDLQDVGVRFYTYISTLEYCMEACAEHNKKLLVLDRPNPNGFYVDGPILEPENKSFVGMQRIPIVYGMTAGEYARMLKAEQWFNKATDLDLEVAKCGGYTHSKKYKLPIAPSPNLRTMAAIYAYPSLCLFEGTNVSVGRGTSMPFQQYGSPEFEGTYGYSFTPRSGEGAKNPPHEGKTCYGEIVGTDEADILKKIDNKLRLKWLIKAYVLSPNKEKFFNAFFIKLSGTAALEAQIKNGDSEDKIRKTWEADLAAFKQVRKKYLLYPDFE